MEPQLQQYNCDSVTISLPSDQIPIVKSWIETRNEKIKELTKENLDIASELKNQEIELNERLSELQRDLDQQKQNQEQEKKAQAQNLDAEISRRVKARISLERQAVTKLSNPEIANLDGLSDRQIKEKVIKKTSSLNDLTTHSDEAIDGMFELALSLPVSIKNQDNGLGSIEPNTPLTNNQSSLREVIDRRSKDVFKESFTIN